MGSNELCQCGLLLLFVPSQEVKWGLIYWSSIAETHNWAKCQTSEKGLAVSGVSSLLRQGRHYWCLTGGYWQQLVTVFQKERKVIRDNSNGTRNHWECFVIWHMCHLPNAEQLSVWNGCRYQQFHLVSAYGDLSIKWTLMVHISVHLKPRLHIVWNVHPHLCDEF